VAADDYSRELLADRTMGQFPISIPTSLAIESAIGILPEAPTDAPEIGRRDVLMLNVRTLLRNLYNTLEASQRPLLEEYTIAEAIAAEIRTIESVIAEHSDGRCAVATYYCSHIDVGRKFSKALIKPIQTPAQKFYWTIETAVMKYLQEDFKATTPISKYVTDFPDIQGEGLILTHYPIDLLQRYRFSSLALLESHTGSVKQSLMWNTKLQNGKDHPNLPFDRMTLQMFGDGVVFSPMPIKIRKRVLEVAQKNNWTPASTKDFVIATIVERRDPALEMLVKDLYRS